MEVATILSEGQGQHGGPEEVPLHGGLDPAVAAVQHRWGDKGDDPHEQAAQGRF